MGFVSSSVFLSRNPIAAVKPRPSADPKLLSLPPAFASRSLQPRVPVARAFPRTPSQNSLAKSLRSTAAGALLLSTTTAALIAAKFHPPPARAEVPASVSTEQQDQTREAEADVEHDRSKAYLGSNYLDSLLSLLQQQLEAGDGVSALSTLQRLMEAQPGNLEWKLVAARLLNDMGETTESHKILDEILSLDPTSFESLFKISVLMDRFGEGDMAIHHLERALELAKNTCEESSARDARLIMAQINFLQKNIDQALEDYEELAIEDPEDGRPYYCQGIIYSLLEKNKEAMEMFTKYHESSPKKFGADAYLKTFLSRTKIGVTEDPHDLNQGN